MNRDELAKSLGISKATLYKRSKELGISKTSLDSLTDEQKNKLMHTKLNYNSTAKTNNENISEIKDHTTHLSDKYTDQALETLKKQNVDLHEQLKIKDTQLNAAQDNITNANKLTEEAQKLADQAQQLQLDLQKKLDTSEKERLSLTNKTNQLTHSNERLDELQNKLTELTEQLTEEQNSKDKLREELSSKIDRISYLESENLDLKKNNDDKEVLIDDQYDSASVYPTIQNANTDHSKLTNEHQFEQEKNKGFWKRLFNH